MNFNNYGFNEALVSDLFSSEVVIIGGHIPFLNLTMRN